MSDIKDLSLNVLLIESADRLPQQIVLGNTMLDIHTDIIARKVGRLQKIAYLDAEIAALNTILEKGENIFLLEAMKNGWTLGKLLPFGKAMIIDADYIPTNFKELVKSLKYETVVAQFENRDWRFIRPMLQFLFILIPELRFGFPSKQPKKDVPIMIEMVGSSPKFLVQKVLWKYWILKKELGTNDYKQVIIPFGTHIIKLRIYAQQVSILKKFRYAIEESEANGEDIQLLERLNAKEVLDAKELQRMLDMETPNEVHDDTEKPLSLSDVVQTEARIKIDTQLTDAEIKQFFSFLYKETNGSDTPFLSEIEVDEILENGFSYTIIDESAFLHRIDLSGKSRSIVSYCFYKFFLAHLKSKSDKEQIALFLKYTFLNYSDTKVGAIKSEMNSKQPVIMKFNIDKYL